MSHPAILRKPRRAFVVTAGIVFALLAAFGRPLQRELQIVLLLRADAPNAEAIQESVGASGDRLRLLRRFWETQRIPHRLAVLDYLRRHTKPLLDAQVLNVLQEAAEGPDLEAREGAFAVLANSHYAGLPELARGQLHDAHPQARLAGLQALRRAGATNLVAEVAAQLSDCDPRVAATAATLLWHWTKQDFGVRTYMANASLTNGQITPENLRNLNEGLGHWREWWQSNQSNYPATPPVSAANPTLSRLLPAPNFSAHDLSGAPIRLRAFRGKAVLLSFLNTSSPQCLAELSALAELQQHHRQRLAIVGIALDGLRDACHEEDHDAASGAHTHSEHGRHDANHPAHEPPRVAVEKAAQRAGVNFPIVHDPTGQIALPFSAVNAPTTVLLDPEGRIRRRWVGPLPSCAWESVLSEVWPATPAPASQLVRHAFRRSQVTGSSQPPEL